jgi:hypothetical protein
VDVEASSLTKPFLAVLTAEWPALGVGVLVVSQVVLPSKGLATHITGKWSLICVSPLMDEKVVGLGELPVAEFANELLLWLSNCCFMLLFLQHMLENNIGRDTGVGRMRW